MGDNGRKGRVFTGNNEVQDVIMTMCGESNMLREVSAVEEG